MSEDVHISTSVDELIGDEIQAEEGQVDVAFVTGAAGTGKTESLKRLIAEDPSAGLLCATTGVAAVNLSTTTLNSTLGYFDTDSLADLFVTGRLVRKLMTVARDYRRLMIDEGSMLPAEQLDIITLAAEKANARQSAQLGITLVGDFAQLPPVKAKWAFEASNWPKYAANMSRLTKVWRQSDREFLDALNLARAGKGKEAAEALRPLAKWSVALDNKFPGTTIVSKNDDVDKINSLRYMQLTGKEKQFKSARWGIHKTEWKHIPEVFRLKIGAYVMILTNKREGLNLVYANGDQGTIVDFAETGVYVRLDRTKETHLIPFISRYVETKDAPESESIYDSLSGELKTTYKANPDGSYPVYDEQRERFVRGAVTYLPVRLAYATTVHKSQGLSLDNVQIDPRGHFFGSENFAYVALSRARTPEGLKIVGTPEILAKRINVDPRVVQWI